MGKTLKLTSGMAVAFVAGMGVAGAGNAPGVTDTEIKTSKIVDNFDLGFDLGSNLPSFLNRGLYNYNYYKPSIFVHS